MSLFHPIAGQYERLMEVLGTMPAIYIARAAALMRVKPAKVAKNIDIMKRRGMFGQYDPQVNQGLGMVVLDDAYLPFAYTLQEAESLLNDTHQAMNLLKDATAAEAPGVARSRAFGSYLRDILTDQPMRGGQDMRSRTRSLLRDLIDPGATTRDETQMERSAMGVIVALENQAESLLNHIRSHPNLIGSHYLPVLQATHRDLNTFLSSLPAARSGSDSWNAQADASLRVIRETDLPRLARLMTEAYEQPSRRSKDPADEIGGQLAQEIVRLETLADQLPDRDMAMSLRKIAGQLSRIRSALQVAPEKARAGSVRSLRECYLPMMDELLGKYMQSLSLSTPASQAAVNATEDLFHNVLPRALSQILSSLETDSANDMRSQADALVKKMQLDGLLPYDFNRRSSGDTQG